MKKYQSSYVLKQIQKKRIFEKKIHMDFPYGFSIQLDTRLVLANVDKILCVAQLDWDTAALVSFGTIS